MVQGLGSRVAVRTLNDDVSQEGLGVRELGQKGVWEGKLGNGESSSCQAELAVVRLYDVYSPKTLTS